MDKNSVSFSESFRRRFPEVNIVCDQITRFFLHARNQLRHNIPLRDAILKEDSEGSHLFSSVIFLEFLFHWEMAEGGDSTQGPQAVEKKSKKTYFDEFFE